MASCTQNNMHESMTRHVQAIVLAKVHRALRELALDLDRPVGDLVGDGVLLVLTFHGRGQGLPEPTPPVPTKGDS
jgi:hypothetical protein